MFPMPTTWMSGLLMAHLTGVAARRRLGFLDAGELVAAEHDVDVGLFPGEGAPDLVVDVQHRPADDRVEHEVVDDPDPADAAERRYRPVGRPVHEVRPPGSDRADPA